MPKKIIKRKKDISRSFSHLTGKAVSEAVGVTTKSITRWSQAGCPRNSDSTYNLPQVIAWLLERERAEDCRAKDESSESQKWLTEFRKERACLARLEREEIEGQIVRAEEVRKGAFNTARAVRDGLLNIPHRVAPILAGESDPNQVASILNREIREALEEISRALEHGICGRPDDSDLAEDEAQALQGSRQ